MGPDEVIHSILSNNAGVTALVGARIYPQVWPQSSTYSLIMYTEIGGGSEMTLSGGCGLKRSQVRIDAVAQTVGESKALAKAIRAALDGYSGVVQTVAVQGIFHIDNDDSPSLAENEELRLFLHRNDFNVHYTG